MKNPDVKHYLEINGQLEESFALVKKNQGVIDCSKSLVKPPICKFNNPSSAKDLLKRLLYEGNVCTLQPDISRDQMPPLLRTGSVSTQVCLSCY